MNKIIAFFLFLFLISCTESDSGFRYTQFTSDDLSFFYYNSDTLNFSGKEFIYKDTISFLLNKTELVRIPVKTDISETKNPLWNINHEYGIQGESEIDFNNGNYSLEATIGVNRQYIDDSGSQKYFYVSVDGGLFVSKFFQYNDSIALETATILGNHFENVINIEADNMSESNIKSIYFAKKYGFIKIETKDGKTLERVLPAI